MGLPSKLPVLDSRPLNDSMFSRQSPPGQPPAELFQSRHSRAVHHPWRGKPPADQHSVDQFCCIGKKTAYSSTNRSALLDSINPLTHQYNNCQVDIDQFNSYTTELRLLQEYRLAHHTSRLVAGLQYMNNDLHRMQLGKGSTGSDYDLSLVDPQWGRNVHLKTNNLALFIENQFQLGTRLAINLGGGLNPAHEHVRTDRLLPGQCLPVSIDHRFPLLGIGASYKAIRQTIEWYGGVFAGLSSHVVQRPDPRLGL